MSQSGSQPPQAFSGRREWRHIYREHPFQPACRHNPLNLGFGESAGGHLAQMALLSSRDDFSGDRELAGTPYTLLAGVSWYGPSSFLDRRLFLSKKTNANPDRFTSRVVGDEENPEAVRKAKHEMSPVTYLNTQSPALMVMQGVEDPVIPVQQAIHMKEEADKAGAPVELLLVENASHGWKPSGGLPSKTRAELIADTVAFLAQHL